MQLVSVAVLPKVFCSPPPPVKINAGLPLAELPVRLQLVSVTVPPKKLNTPPPPAPPPELPRAEFPVTVQLVSVAVSEVVVQAAAVGGGVAADGAVG